jgi:hypothetical protein
MLAKMWTVAVAAAVLAIAVPAAYAQTTTAPAAKPAATTKPMAKKSSHHKMNCMDYAWQSAAMNDCLAKQNASGTGEGTTKPMKKSKKKKTVS